MCLCMTIPSFVAAQVTIGSENDPNPGALLDLKEEVSTNDVTALKGLLMPRVKLTDRDKLFPMFDAVSGANYTKNGDDYDKDTQDAIHTGLSVYHIDKCSFNGAGIYVWDGQQWQPLLEGNASGINLPTDKLFLPSGHDLRTLNPGYTFDISWTPSGSGTTPPTWSYEPGATLIPTSLTPASGSLSTTSPQTMTLIVPKIPDAVISANLFASREATVNFESSVCADSKTFIINQTNKALLVNGTTTPGMKLYAAPATNQKLNITSNAKWKLSVSPASNSAISNTSPVEGSILGSEEENNAAAPDVIQSFDVSTGANLHRYSFLTFSDTQTPKRFGDVLYTISQCSGEHDLTLREYVDLWEQIYGLIDGVDEPDSDGNTTLNKNKVRWHYTRPDLAPDDPKQSIFFSTIFGTERWMSTNLSNKYYTPRTGETGEWTAAPALTNSYNVTTLPHKTAYWGYPNIEGNTDPSDASLYNTRQRLGLLYNWSAATGNQNSSKGEQINTVHGPHQGICPSGWHLPTNLEWSNLLTELEANPRKYSTNNVGISTGYTAKDACEVVAGTGKSFGILEGGFNYLFTGYANWQTYDYGNYGYYWTASSGWPSSNGEVAYYRILDIIFDESVVADGGQSRSGHFSVRCKKDE
ncbi:hypothetical protein KL86DYS1_11282 [uncultured Dysgonomonas sp.]|uniref:Fibrobacter succinogenes major paralogous domain-containing protein n=2 Tax=uncultured Dysgonomonas sp. TaxID=206096 RepID=A0A212J6F9_9BACT|nr:hypothetical protein KL86DYS1_11282 [uncultured Dysgonomonas sp.]